MTDVSSLLPPNASSGALACEQALARATGMPVVIDQLWDPLTYPIEVLPTLAWALSIQEWDTDWPESIQRATVAASIAVHQKRGTISAVRDVLAAAGFGEAVIVEGQASELYDGTHIHDGSQSHSEPDHWAVYRVYLERAITIDRAALLQALLRSVTPARCHLGGLFFTQAANRHGGEIDHDGGFTYGVV